MNRYTGIVLALAIGLLLATSTPAQDKTKAGAGQDEMTQAMLKAAAVGPQHQKLKTFAGKWTIKGKCRTAPDAPWEEHKNSSTIESILGGRFLEQRYQGDAIMGAPTPFEGFGILGYDNQAQKYVSSWADNMGTMILTSEGTSEDDGKTITLRSAEFTCPVTGQRMTMKTVYQIESNDRFVLRLYTPGPDGKEFEGMEFVHTRASN